MADHHFGRTRRDASLSPAERADARAALKLLEGSGLSLEAAARRAIEGRAAIRRMSVEDCADLFLRDRLKRVRAHTWDFYEVRISAIRDRFGSLPMDGVSREDFRKWIAAMEVSETTRAGYVRTARALWRWAAAQEPPLAGPPPTHGMGTNTARGRRIGYLTPGEVAGILAEPSPWRSALALMLFAGLRVEELAGKGKPALDWRAVDVSGKTIRIDGEIAKVSGQPRLLQGLPATVWHWLPDPAPSSGRICPGLSVNAVKWAKSRLGRAWPKNGLRHTFATYAVALTGEPDRVGGWLGHLGGSGLLHGHYAGLARKAEAEAFFALRPASAEQEKAPAA